MWVDKERSVRSQVRGSILCPDERALFGDVD